jgi:hypothetical protein
MRNSLSMRAARACAAGTLLLFVALAPAVAHVSAPSAGPAARGGLHRVNRFGFNHSRIDHFDSRRFRLNRFGSNANALFSGLDGSDYWNYPPSYPTGPIIVGSGAPPAVINVFAGGDPGASEVGAAGGVACPVVHLLEYDAAGRYVGERQLPAC